MGKNYIIVFFRVVAMLIIVLFYCFCYNLGIWSNLPSLPYPHSYFISPVILSTIGLSVFVIISGYLYGFGFFHFAKYHDSYGLLRKKFFRLIVPYIIWALITYILFYHSFYWKQIFAGIAHLWFLLMLYNCFFFATITKSIWGRFKGLGIVLLIIIFFFISYLRGTSLMSHFWIFAIRETFSWLYLFFLGILLSYYKLLDKLPTLSKNSTLLRCFIFLDKNSMGVYILHHIFIWIVIYYFPFVRNLVIANPVGAPWILFVIVLPTSLFSANIIGKLKYSQYIFG